MNRYFVYILASNRNGTFYTGVTDNIIKRVWQHKDGLADGFTKKYNVKTLVYFEEHLEIMNAIQREKNIKRWKRLWKIQLVEKSNPQWIDLYDKLLK